MGESTAALAHSLAGSSATVGYVDLSDLARSLEHALMRSIAIGRATPGEPQLFNDAAEEIRRLLHQFAAGFLKRVSAPLMKRLEQHELDVAALTPRPGWMKRPTCLCMQRQMRPSRNWPPNGSSRPCRSRRRALQRRRRPSLRRARPSPSSTWHRCRRSARSWGRRR